MRKQSIKHKWPLPADPDVEGEHCLIVPVPANMEYLAAWRGAQLSLAAAYNWADDADHTALAAAAVFLDVIDRTIEVPCESIQEPQYFLAQDTDDPDGQSLGIYDLQTENDVNFKAKSQFVVAPVVELLTNHKAAMRFQLYDGGAVCGGHITQLRVSFDGDIGAAVPTRTWTDCFGDDFEDDVSSNPFTWNGVDVTKLSFTSVYAITLAITYTAVSPCVF